MIYVTLLFLLGFWLLSESCGFKLVFIRWINYV